MLHKASHQHSRANGIRLRIISLPPLGPLAKRKYLDMSDNHLSAPPEGAITLPNLEATKIRRNDMHILRTCACSLCAPWSNPQATTTGAATLREIMNHCAG